ncbi:MAG: T9SS type A sorting domain-containing protein [Bacteroidetes bacterium]|nr:T9SS type A sorting domain-containing protein [Bacteroidota bacterium]
MFTKYISYEKNLLSLILALTSTVAAMASGHTVGISSQNNVACTGCATGSATLTVNGGAGPFTYNWSPGGWSTASVTGMIAGFYTVTATDQNDLSTASALVTITEPFSALAISSNTLSLCQGDCSKQFTTAASGGTPVYSYTWQPGTGLSSNSSSSPTVCIAVTTTYTITITDSNGCTAKTTAVATENPVPVISVPGASICPGASVLLTASGATTYTWSPGTGLSSTVGATVTANPSGNTTYTVIGAFNGCTGSTTVVVTVSPPTVPNFTINPSPACFGQAVTFTDLSLGGTIATWNWNFGNPTTLADTSRLQNPSYSYPSPGTYTCILRITNVFGCTGTVSRTLTVSSSLTGVTVSGSVYKETCMGIGDGAIYITLSGSNTGPFTYQWSNGSTNQDITNLLSNNYILTIYDSNMNCLSSSYSVSPDGTNCGSISGNVFEDINTDCINNAGDQGLSNIMVIANPGNYKAFTNNQGNYVFNAMPYGTYTLTQQISNPYIFPACTSTLNTNLSVGNKNITNLNFADSIDTIPKDVSVSAYSKGIVPGFSCSVVFSLNNLTNVPASGTLCIVLPTGYGAFATSGNPGGYNVNGDTVCWSYTTLTSALYYEIYFTVPVNTPLGSVFTTCATATIIGMDINPANNYYCYTRYVAGSFDPNDKSVNPIGDGPQGNITLADNTLNYHINFQNTGNGPAVNITVKDTLSNKLDINTLEVTGISHNYILDVLPGNVLRWEFNNIMLADSGNNEPASHGWIAYKVKQKSSNQIGDQIKNTAYIYFDFNSAVITNTTLNTISTPTVIEKLSGNKAMVKVFPNPFSDNTTFIIQSDKSNEIFSFELLDVLGKQVRSTKEITGKEFHFSRNGLPNGIYFYKFYTAESTVDIGKLIIK